MIEAEQAWTYLRKSKYNDIMESEELKEVLCLSGKDVTDKQVSSIMKNEGGIISYDRFIEIADKIKPISSNDIIKAFRTFDVNGDNYISLAELKALLGRLGEKMSSKEIDRIFDLLDANKDGKLDYKEFTGLYENASKQLGHLLSVRALPDETPSTDSKKPTNTILSSVTLTETETETETESDDEDDDIVVVPKKNPFSSTRPDPTTTRTTKPVDIKKPFKSESKTPVLEKQVRGKNKEPASKDKTILKTTNKSISSSKSSKDPKAKGVASTELNVRGCTYAGERGDWSAHQYQLAVPRRAQIQLSLSPLAQSAADKALPDLTAYIVDKDDPTQVYMSNKYSDLRVHLDCVLAPGDYTILTHTTSCNFVNESTLPVTPLPVRSEQGSLSSAATKVFNDIFHCLDLNGDGLLDREEFGMFHFASSGEKLDTSMWQVIRDNVEMREGGLTVGGFLQLQQLALEDEEGGEDEVRETLTSMGYNEALELVKAVPWHFSIVSSEGVHLTVTHPVALTSNQLLEQTVVRCLEKHGEVVQDIEGKCKLISHTLPWKSTSAVKNITDGPLRIEVNTVGSDNCLENPPYRKHILTVAPSKTMICHHFSPEFHSKNFKPTIKIRIVPPAKPRS